MPTRITIATYDEKHKQNLAKRAKKVSNLYDAAVKRLTQAAAPSLFDADKEQEFHFEDFPALKKEMDALMQDLYSSLQTNIEDGDEESWTLANTKNDAMVESVIGKAKLPKQTVEAWKHPHLEALNAFIDRKEAGMGLSKRVWNLTQQFKDEMELALELGMGEGKSAAELSRDIRKYLKEPSKLFRRVRDKSGALRLSKAAAAYHPGRGVYRSSYKNALRMTATENNMAYRTADHTRWQALPFVLGIEVRISNNHPIPDICDELAGRYPVEFKFTGWHPWCRCYAVSILAKQEEMDAYIKALIAGEDVSDWQFTGKVEEIPTEFTKWMKDNENRIAKAKSMPYFIKDNFKDGDPTKGLRWEGKKPDQEKKPAKTKQENIPGNQKEQTAEFGRMDKKEAVKEIMSQAKVDTEKADFMYESIRDFSFGSYQDMRTVQMGGTDIWDLRYSVKEWKKRVDACEEFIEKSPKWNGGTTYRGMHISEEQMQSLREKMEKKRPIDMQGMASWSTSKDMALGYTFPNSKTPIRVILETDDAQNGTSIAHISIHPTEREILCSMRNKYVIKEITKEQGSGFEYYRVKVENTAQLTNQPSVKKPTAKEIAAKRHAARTKEAADDIQARWNESRNNAAIVAKAERTMRIAERYPAHNTLKLRRALATTDYAKIAKVTAIERSQLMEWCEFDRKAIEARITLGNTQGIDTGKRNYILHCINDVEKALASKGRKAYGNAKAGIAELEKELNALTLGSKQPTFIERMDAGETTEQLVARLGKDCPPTLKNFAKIANKLEADMDGEFTQAETKLFKDTMRDMFKKYDFASNTDAKYLENILDEHLKCQQETKSSGGMLNVNTRTNFSELTFGTPKGTKAKDFEKYGFLTDKDLSKREQADWYGGTTIRLKKDKINATFTMGDSLDDSDVLTPSLVTDPKINSLASDERMKWQDNATLKAFSAAAKTSVTKACKALCDTCYIELQYHGEVTADCIDSIVFSSWQEAKKAKAAIKKALALNIPCYYIETISGKNTAIRFSSTARL